MAASVLQWGMETPAAKLTPRLPREASILRVAYRASLLHRPKPPGCHRVLSGANLEQGNPNSGSRLRKFAQVKQEPDTISA